MPKAWPIQNATESTVDLVTTCPWCNKSENITVTRDELTRWLSGAYVQDALSNHNADEREQILTGICPTCWSNAFNEKEE